MGAAALDAVQRTGGEAHDAYRGRALGRCFVQAEALEQVQEAFLDLSGPAGGVFGLDGQLQRPPGRTRLGHQLKKPFQGEYGGELARHRIPVGRLLAVLPGTEVESGEIGELQRGDGATAVGRTVHPAVVHTDELAVRGEPDIALQGVGAVLDRFAVGGQGVLGCVVGGSAVGDDLDGRLWCVLPCVGHRVMVSP
ncbi:hypothetical protein ACVWXU_005066 [Streptomyces sp. TE33382]